MILSSEQQWAYSEGVTLRDYFAVHATDEDIRRYLWVDNERTDTTHAQARYMHADAMLAAREETEG